MTIALPDVIAVVTGAAGGKARASGASIINFSSVGGLQCGLLADHPIGPIGRADEMGGGVVYLASDSDSFVTGSELVIDGGFTSI